MPTSGWNFAVLISGFFWAKAEKVEQRKIIIGNNLIFIIVIFSPGLSNPNLFSPDYFRSTHK
jgi:hypothetical protein